MTDTGPEILLIEAERNALAMKRDELVRQIIALEEQIEELRTYHEAE
jgi:vacuolar-type H+-ATPase subunit D/Vma8